MVRTQIAAHRIREVGGPRYYAAGAGCEGERIWEVNLDLRLDSGVYVADWRELESVGGVGIDEVIGGSDRDVLDVTALKLAFQDNQTGHLLSYHLGEI